MVQRRFVVRHKDAELPVDYDTEDGLEVLKFQIYSLTSVPPEEQKIVTCGDEILVTESSDLASVSEKLCLLSVRDEAEGKTESTEHLQISDAELARMLQAEEEALFFQEFRASGDRGEFEQRVRPYVAQVLMYEDPVRQEAARKLVPVDELEEKALVALAKEGNFLPSKDEKQHAFLLQLLFWFKQSFRWVNSPPCDHCGSGTSSIGMGSALPSEIKFGGSRVELYRCNICSNITRFPRYNDPMKLLETRRGRCGEWANCFTLFCRAFGYESRLILDFTDHVWTECFSHFLRRWMHLDPCDGVFDNPLLYEKGWNKNLNYVIAIAKDGVYDVTKRYTRKWHEVLPRRTITTEVIVSAVLSDIRKQCRNGYSSEILSTLEYRDRKETEELERGLHLQVNDSISLPGRQSGAIEWRIARSEVGRNENTSLSCSSCPVRICVDAHVGRIYNAFSFLLSHFVDNDISKYKSIEILGIMKRMLVNLKNSPFKARSSFLNLNASECSENMMSCIEGLLSAISLKGEMEDGRMIVSLAGDPVKTSIALPVALDAVNEIVDDLNGGTCTAGDVMQFPKLSRLSSGCVLASGEELPFGIATAAFDGTRMTKWEEPNGAKGLLNVYDVMTLHISLISIYATFELAMVLISFLITGCWLIYKVVDDQMHDLESYELMSANDAPERDPTDWILEGSEDGGLTWNVLDQQSSQIFEKRFQRKTFRVDSRCKSNAFRFRFLTVRDPKSQSRFQIGSIDLYARGT